MQKLIAISCSFLILIQSINISFEDMSKISVLLEHAEFHQQTYGDSIFEFLTEHYGESNVVHGTDHEEHEDLPFKHHHQSCAHTNVAFTFETLKFNLSDEPFIEIPINFFYKESTSLFEKSSVFQPPQLA